MLGLMGNVCFASSEQVDQGKFVYSDDLNQIIESANKGNREDLYLLAVFHEHGDGVPKNLDLAIDLYERSAAKGYHKAQYNLGVMYAEGRGVEQDFELAAELYQQAAQQGYYKAKFNLGLLYLDGRGVELDLREAFRLVKEAADQVIEAPDQKSAKIIFTLGVFYGKGWGVGRNNSETVRLLELAAKHGYDKAQYNLGVLYENGEMGVIQDLRTAAYYYKQAAEQGYDLAKQAVADLQE